MSHRLHVASMLVATICVLALPAAAVSSTDPINYELKFERPSTHLLDITIRADGMSGASADFAMPDWAPGSYYIENYAVNVQHFRAHSAAGDGGRERLPTVQLPRVRTAL